MYTLADRILNFYGKVSFNGELPSDISIMNPYADSELIREICKVFYQKYYADNAKRHLILGINPGRLGGGSTGIPFTDTKRLNSDCNISFTDFSSHEPSSVYVYDLIRAYGGPDAFYQKFYINSICPLGFTITNKAGKEVNYNYYDRKDLQDAVGDFILVNIRMQIDLGCYTDKVYCFGTGKNFHYLNKINEKHRFFGQIIALEHPRYIMQYKSKLKENYVDDFLKKLS
jgi:hypothetical protein